MTQAQIDEIVDAFAQGARRAREAGADGVEVHGCNGYLITQFLSSAINDRDDEYGGSLENRARFALEVVRAIRREVGDDYHVQFKISPREHLRDIYPWMGDGNTLEESMQVCKWLEEAGVDGFHVSTGGAFPHPRNPPGKMPLADLARTYDSMVSSGRHAFRNLVAFRVPPLKWTMQKWWERPLHGRYEGQTLPDAAAVKRRGRRAGALRGRFPDRVGDPGGDRVRRRGRRDDGADGARQPGPAEAVRRGPRPRAAAVHVLQQVPRQLRREPARVLRREPLRVARADDRGDHDRVRPAGLQGARAPARTATR